MYASSYQVISYHYHYHYHYYYLYYCSTEAPSAQCSQQALIQSQTPDAHGLWNINYYHELRINCSTEASGAQCPRQAQVPSQTPDAQGLWSRLGLERSWGMHVRRRRMHMATGVATTHDTHSLGLSAPAPWLLAPPYTHTHTHAHTHTHTHAHTHTHTHTDTHTYIYTY